MLSKPGPLPTGDGWMFEPKWDGFRAIVSTIEALSVRSRRGWQMAGRVPVKNRAYWRYPEELELARGFRSRSPFSAQAFS
jgi:ATP-dependent DNA ligase